MLLANNFLFIHIDKAAGTSIQRALQPHAFPRANSRLRRRLTWLGRLNRLGLHRVVEFPEHVTAGVVKDCLPPEIYGGLFKFAFVRNPWDRLVSRYHFLLRSDDRSDHHRIKAMKNFEEYLRWEIERDKFYQHSYVVGADGKLIVDFIGYYERLEKDFATVCDRLKVSATLPKANTSKHDDYRSYYNTPMRELVAWHYRRDIELFHYEFAGVASKK